MRKIRKTELKESDLEFIKDIHTNSECYSKLEFYKMILDQFNSDELIDELIQNNICVECFEQELETQEVFEDEFQSFTISQCNACGHMIDLN